MCVGFVGSPERADAHILKLTTGTAPSPRPWATAMLWSQSSRGQKALAPNPRISKLLRDSGACWDWGPESTAKKRLGVGWKRFQNWNVTLGHKEKNFVWLQKVQLWPIWKSYRKTDFWLKIMKPSFNDNHSSKTEWLFPKTVSSPSFLSHGSGK